MARLCWSAIANSRVHLGAQLCMPSNPFRLKTFGGLALFDGAGTPCSERGLGPERLALLAVLVAHGKKGIPRDTLGSWFWPEASEDKVRHNLAQAIHRIRKATAEEAIVTSPLQYCIEPEIVTSDLTEFNACLASGERERAMRVYGGPFLLGLSTPFANGFEDWRFNVDTRVTRDCRSALNGLHSEAMARDPSRAVDWAELLVSLERGNADAVLRLMQAEIASGRVPNALDASKAYLAFVRSNELDVDSRVGQLVAQLSLRGPSTDSVVVPVHGARTLPSLVGSADLGAGDVPVDADGDGQRFVGPPTDNVVPYSTVAGDARTPTVNTRRGAPTKSLILALVAIFIAFVGGFLVNRTQGRETTGGQLPPSLREQSNGVLRQCFGFAKSEEHSTGDVTLVRTAPRGDAGCFFLANRDNARFTLDPEMTTRVDITPVGSDNGSFYSVAFHFWYKGAFVGETDWLKNENTTEPRSLQDVRKLAAKHECKNDKNRVVPCYPATQFTLQFRIQPEEFDIAVGRPSFRFAAIQVRTVR